MKKMIKWLARRLPYLSRISTELDQYRREQLFPPGHYYSPVPSVEEVKLKAERIFGEAPGELPSIDLNDEGQIGLFHAFKKFYDEMAFPEIKNSKYRYYFKNSWYTYSDAIALYCMIRHLRPRRIIEVGSGFSSCVILDTNELYFDNSIECTFIEPNPERLLSLIREGDADRVSILRCDLQDVKLSRFSELCENDIILIDSSHVSKIGSDVNYIIFDILPFINVGVSIHFHDIFFPFEYPKNWVLSGRAWNEAYLLRAFLQYNNSFMIQYFNTYIESRYRELFLNEMPLCLEASDGDGWVRTGSIWIRKM